MRSPSFAVDGWRSSRSRAQSNSAPSSAPQRGRSRSSNFVRRPAQCDHDGRSAINTFQEMEMRGLEGRVALVTGPGGGIGRAICSRFVEEGINVIAADIDEGSLRSFSQSTGSGRGAYPVRLDVTDFTAVQKAVEDAVSRFGCVDILVNNAGWDVARPFVETAPDFWDKVIAINLKGPLNLHHAVLPHMIRTGQGKIINIASDAGRVVRRSGLFRVQGRPDLIHQDDRTRMRRHEHCRECGLPRADRYAAAALRRGRRRIRQADL